MFSVSCQFFFENTLKIRRIVVAQQKSDFIDPMKCIRRLIQTYKLFMSSCGLASGKLRQ
ncbi:MAG: hypothetical protein H6Q14_277 [Bacteroidetes bacterium]|nr:hypothetical protein [Bacteroidota bacterium]